MIGGMKASVCSVVNKCVLLFLLFMLGFILNFHHVDLLKNETSVMAP